jgi:hypothetical protein
LIFPSRIETAFPAMITTNATIIAASSAKNHHGPWGSAPPSSRFLRLPSPPLVDALNATSEADRVV